jgi:hypothetical protein
MPGSPFAHDVFRHRSPFASQLIILLPKPSGVTKPVGFHLHQTISAISNLSNLYLSFVSSFVSNPSLLYFSKKPQISMSHLFNMEIETHIGLMD